MIHELKTVNPFFEDVLMLRKQFEVRKDDRGFAMFDTLRLREFVDGKYTGRAVEAQVGYILRGGEFGIEAGYVVMQLELVTRVWGCGEHV